MFGGGLAVRAPHDATALALYQLQSFAIRLLISSLKNEISFAEQPDDKKLFSI